MNTFFESVVTIARALVTLGGIAVLVSKKAQTPQVVQSFGSAFSNAMAVAESPVTGATYNVNLGYPGQDMTGSFGFG